MNPASNGQGAAPVYELVALRYATSIERTTRENFLWSRDLHDGPMPLDFFVWAAISDERVVLIDGGSDAALCARRGHRFLACPTELLAEVGVTPERVQDLVITHAHWDHMGNIDKFPNARLHVHKAEMAYATGCSMCHPGLRRPYDVDQVCSVVRALYGDRVRFTTGGETVAPGITVHHMGGHTPGLQVVRVNTRRGQVVLASDAMHYYANASLGNPFTVVVDVREYLDAFGKISELADGPENIVAGHDPVTLALYPPWTEALRGRAVRLDVPPSRLPASVLPKPGDAQSHGAGA